jgi:hypothetical protein
MEPLWSPDPAIRGRGGRIGVAPAPKLERDVELPQTMRVATTEERDTTIQYGVEQCAKGGFARIDALLQQLQLDVEPPTTAPASVVPANADPIGARNGQ